MMLINWIFISEEAVLKKEVIFMGLQCTTNPTNELKRIIVNYAITCKDLISKKGSRKKIFIELFEILKTFYYYYNYE